jgi:hypothetical protein
MHLGKGISANVTYEVPYIIFMQYIPNILKKQFIFSCEILEKDKM